MAQRIQHQVHGFDADSLDMLLLECGAQCPLLCFSPIDLGSDLKGDPPVRAAEAGDISVLQCGKPPTRTDEGPVVVDVGFVLEGETALHGPPARQLQAVGYVEVDGAEVGGDIEHSAIELRMLDHVAEDDAVEQGGGGRDNSVLAHPDVVRVEEDLVELLGEVPDLQVPEVVKGAVAPESFSQFDQRKRPIPEFGKHRDRDGVVEGFIGHAVDGTGGRSSRLPQMTVPGRFRVERLQELNPAARPAVGTSYADAAEPRR